MCEEECDLSHNHSVQVQKSCYSTGTCLSPVTLLKILRSFLLCYFFLHIVLQFFKLHTVDINSRSAISCNVTCLPAFEADNGPRILLASIYFHGYNLWKLCCYSRSWRRCTGWSGGPCKLLSNRGCASSFLPGFSFSPLPV